jgi:glycosyltransferase involved in cell wall biosynthesis
MDFKYDISIIIPVYNCEEYIDECLTSIINQKYDKNKIQVICVNDGSKDNSLDVLSKYESDNIIVIDKENSGVSATRNVALKQATGKYLMFLDSDDFLSLDTCRLLFEFFEENYDKIDVVYYPRIDYNNLTHKETTIKRFDSYKGTGIYDLTKKPWLFNPTLNIITKNRLEDNYLFDEKVIFHEDEKYNMRLVYDKKTVGFVEEASYYYRIHETSTTSLKSNPYYCYENYIGLFEDSIKNYKTEKGIPEYITWSMYNDMRWRINQNVFFPKHYDDEAFKKELVRIKNIVDNIDEDLVLYDVSTSIYFKEYFLRSFGSKDISFKFDNHNYQVFYGDKLFFYNNSVEIELNKYRIKNNTLNIVADIKTPFDGYIEYELYEKVVYKGKETINKITTTDTWLTIYNRINGGIKGKYFEKKYDINNIDTIEYYIVIDGHKIPTVFVFGKNIPFSKSLSRYVYKNTSIFPNSKLNKVLYVGNIKFAKTSYDELKKYKYTNTKIVIKKRKDKNMLKNKILADARILKRTPKDFLIGRFIINKKIWLYMDRDNVLENAFIQFKYDLNKNDGVKRYYITDLNTNNKSFKGIQGNIIKRNSIKHKRLYLACEKIITTHALNFEYKILPTFSNYYTDKANYELIYINNCNFKYTGYNGLRKFESQIDKFILQDESEKESLINNYYYDDEDVYVCGFPKMDVLEEKEEKNKILMVLSKRQFLIKKIWPLELYSGMFKYTRYYESIRDIMKSERINDLLEKNNLKLDINLSSYFKDYISHLQGFESNNINLVKNYNLSEYKALITDFSEDEYSYLNYNRPILYYLFDIPELSCGLHYFRNFVHDDNMMYGPVIHDKEEFIKELTSVIENNYKIEDKYVERRNKNKVITKDTCEKVYQAEMSKYDEI